MINKEVRRELFRRVKISRQALNQRAKRLKEKYGPMTTDEAVYVIAHMEGVDLGRYLPLDILDRVRSLVPRDIRPQSIKTPVVAGKAKPRKKTGVVSYPLVKEAVIRNALAIGDESFPQVFVLENSIRILIERTLSALNVDWWTTYVPGNVQKRVQHTIEKEKKYPYREKRGSKPLLYCNFADLKEIIVANYAAFSYVIVDLDWFKTKMDEVYMARNNLAHSITLSKDDISRIALFYKDWARLLESGGVK